MRPVRVFKPSMSSCHAGGSRAPSSATSAATATAATTYCFDHLEIEIFKPSTTSARKSPHSSPSRSLTSTSSPSSTISEASNSLSPQLSLSTRRPRTPRKRPNQTYDEAAALLSIAYPNIFCTKNLAKPPFKFSKRAEPNWANPNANPSTTIKEELLVPLSIPAKTVNSSSNFEPRLALGSISSSSDSNEKACQSSQAVPEEEENEFQFYKRREEDDFDAESILDEEIGEGIDSIMGNLASNSSNDNHNHYQTTSKFCYGIPMGSGLGLGLGLLGSRIDFGFGKTRAIRAFRNCPDEGLNGDWWRCPVTTVEVGAISPRLEKKEEEAPAAATARNGSSLSEKKKSKRKKVKEEGEEEESEKVSAAGMGEVKESKAVERGESSAAPSGTERRINLKLNYDDVLSAWSDKGSLFSEDIAGSELAGSDVSARLAQIDLFGESGGGGVGRSREASVQRYKEKRRTRLYSKKIRYQVRKVNADQRPRMKGRFVRGPDSTGGGGQT